MGIMEQRVTLALLDSVVCFAFLSFLYQHRHKTKVFNGAQVNGCNGEALLRTRILKLAQAAAERPC